MGGSLMMWGSAFVAIVLVVMAGAAELMPTQVGNVPLRTQPPEEVSRPQFAQTLLKATDHVTVKNTLIPLWPSYTVEYQATHTTTVINQTIPTSTAEFATVVNTTVWYLSPLRDTESSRVAATTYQTMEFHHQTVLYTDRANQSHTDYENNGLPFL
ncbi:hypothetical protein Pmani_001596 [Petrolisthes manimaculis]|uniref:Uncharacterized protein n=1 Tax=Petrolisthes manimaculis TaxID=1843537 RepID=A0AAE1QMF4_9EUCA|nr:hypothetical protein Pmani_001596 [Petrolisthes manimaculis]